MKKELICIVCPMSCHIEVEMDDCGKVLHVQGNTCKRGEQYARTEMENPVRMVTSTVRIEGGLYRRLPVITSQAIPKGKIMEVMEAINHVTVCAPIRINDIIIKEVCGLPVDIVASRSMEEALS